MERKRENRWFLHLACVFGISILFLFGFGGHVSAETISDASGSAYAGVQETQETARQQEGDKQPGIAVQTASDPVSASSTGMSTSESTTDTAEETSSAVESSTGTLITDASYWSKFSSTYYYSQLSDAQKKLYDALDGLCTSYLTGMEDLSTVTKGSITTALTGMVDYKELGLTKAQATQALYLFHLSNPQYYFINEYTYFDETNGLCALGVYTDLSDGVKRQSYTSCFSKAVEDALSQVSGTSDPEKTVFQWIVSNFSYESTDLNQGCYNAFTKKKALCAGYSEAFAMLNNALGMPAVSVISQWTGGGHEWNMVLVDGIWYNVDTTWADTDTLNGPYTYYNISTSSLQSHGEKKVHKVISAISSKVPTASVDQEGNSGTILENSSPKRFYLSEYSGVDYSDVYNYAEYIANYSDLAKVYGTDNNEFGALLHFIQYGMKEGRTASSSFHVTGYRYRYQDLRLAFGKDLASYYMHYIQHGKGENRDASYTDKIVDPITKWDGVDYSAVYDFEYYYGHNGDLQNALGYDDIALLKHFINFGMKEGRKGKESFSVTGYKNRYSDLRKAFGSDLKQYYLHYIQPGQKENRNGSYTATVSGYRTIWNGIDYSAVYDYNYYLAHYADVASALGSREDALLEHFVTFGMKEGRQAISIFNVYHYKARYTDLAKAFGSDLKQYYLHYIQYGKKEGRNAV